MPSALDQLNSTELLIVATKFLAEAVELPDDDPWKAELLQAVRQLLDRVKSRGHR